MLAGAHNDCDLADPSAQKLGVKAKLKCRIASQVEMSH
jgi:hypothetical protein